MIVETERLRLTPVGPDDVADLLTLHGDPWVARWNAGPWTPEHARAYAEEMAARWQNDGVGKWMARDRVSGDLIGRGGVSHSRVDGVLSYEVGWAVRDRHLRQGYASEIGRAGLAYAFERLGAAEVVAFTEVHNVASRGVMERLGMAFDKIIFAYGLVEGTDRTRDDAPFALYRIGP